MSHLQSTDTISINPIEEREDLVPLRDQLPSVTARNNEWRDRFLDMIQGIKLGFRANSAMFVHFFLLSMLLSTCVVVQVDSVGASIVTICVTLIITGELLYYSVQRLVGHYEQVLPEEVQQIAKMARAAFMALIIGSFLALTILLAYQMKTLDWF